MSANYDYTGKVALVTGQASDFLQIGGAGGALQSERRNRMPA